MLTSGGNKYFITFIDDYSRFTLIYLLKHKDDAFNALIFFKADVENQLSISIKVLRSDRDCKYFYIKFDAYSKEYDNILECSALCTPQQNSLFKINN